MPEPFHSGFVAIIGRPNAGKSTLVNRLVGQKVAIVTSRPQTTRNRILGIVNSPGVQLVLIDTPGIHQAESALGRQMMSEVSQAIEGIDVLALMIDASAGLTPTDKMAFDRASRFNGPVFLLLNKIDLVPRTTLLPLLEACSKESRFQEMIPISALNGDGMDIVLSRLVARLPEGGPYFPPDQFTDQPERFLVSEIVREKAMSACRQEVPHSLAVIVESFEELSTLIRIRAVIQVEREGQKGILIGKGGEKLREFGTAARREIEKFLGVKVYLDLQVKVEPDWRDDSKRVQLLDWRRQLERLGGQ